MKSACRKVRIAIHLGLPDTKRRGLVWRSCQGQGAVETAVVLPFVILVFLGCLQLLQTVLAQLVVMQAVYEAGRQAYIHAQNLEQGRQAAVEICRGLSRGRTEFVYETGTGKYRVTHYLKPIFPLFPSPEITRDCPAFVFGAGDQGGPFETR